MTGEEISPNQVMNKYGIPMAGKPIKACYTGVSSPMHL